MFIKKTKLKNYRNFKNIDIDFLNGINIIYGKNAQGKTNILESIYMTATTKSHRTIKDNEIITFGEEEGHIKSIFKENEKSEIIDIHLKKKENKGIAVNGIKINKISDYLGLINVVFFSPEDLNIIKDGPNKRRKFLDFYICQIDKLYIYNLSKYNKILNQRNKLLKDITNNNDLIETLDAWDNELVKYGFYIINKRENIIKELDEVIYKKHFFISEEKEKLKTFYEKNVDKNLFLKKLKEKRDEDIKYKTTTIGPHRDDLKFMIEEIDIRKYGSQGQQKTAALSIKFSEIESLIKKNKKNPILLLDDVFSELDENRQKLLIKNINNIQTIITCTGISIEILKILSPDRIYKLNNCKIEIKK